MKSQVNVSLKFIMKVYLNEGEILVNIENVYSSDIFLIILPDR